MEAQLISKSTPINRANANADFTKSQTQRKEISSLNSKTNFIQTKLTVNKPGDAYEQEADRVANQVVGMNPADIQTKSLSISTIQRQCAACEKEDKNNIHKKEMSGGVEEKEKELHKKEMSGGVEEKEKELHKKEMSGGVEEKEKELHKKEMSGGVEEKEKELHKKEMSGGIEEKEKEVHRKEMNSDNHLENYVGNLNSGGQALPNDVRGFFEPRFGHDFSNVKVHTDSVAAKSAQSINALAYTSGNNIVFNQGQYAPGTDSGKRLLAHELTHVVQQGGAGEINRNADFSNSNEKKSMAGGTVSKPGLKAKKIQMAGGRLYKQPILSPVIQRSVTSLAVAGGTAETGHPNDFVAARGGGNITITATTSAPGLDVTWSGGSPVRGNPLQRLVRPARAGTTTITADTPAAPGSQTTTIHTISSRPLPANTPAELGFSRQAGNPAGLFGATCGAGCFGFTDINNENPTIRVEPFLNGNTWNFRVLRIHNRYRMGIDSKGRTDIPNATSSHIPADFCPVIAGFTPVSPIFLPGGAGLFWSSPIIRTHEECHVNRFYSPAFWPAFMRTAEATVEAAGMNVPVDHTVPNTLSAATVLAANLPAIQTVFDTEHANADAAEMPTSEAACHAQSNARFTTLIAEIAARHRPVAPTALAAVAGGPPTSVALTWTDNACNETEYRVYRRRGRGAFTAINFLPAGTAAFTDTTAGLVPATAYTYKVVAVGTAGESRPSNLVNVTTL